MSDQRKIELGNTSKSHQSDLPSTVFHPLETGNVLLCTDVWLQNINKIVYTTAFVFKNHRVTFKYHYNSHFFYEMRTTVRFALHTYLTECARWVSSLH